MEIIFWILVVCLAVYVLGRLVLASLGVFAAWLGLIVPRKGVRSDT